MAVAVLLGRFYDAGRVAVAFRALASEEARKNQFTSAPHAALKALIVRSACDCEAVFYFL